VVHDVARVRRLENQEGEMNEITRRQFCLALAGLALAQRHGFFEKMIMSCSRRKLVVREQAERTDYETRILAAESTISAAQIVAVNRFIHDLKAADVWNKIQDMGVFCGDDLTAALVKLKYTSGDGLLTNVGFTADEFSVEGLTGDGDGMSVNTGFRPGADYHLAFWAGDHTRDGSLNTGIGAVNRTLGRNASDDIEARYAASSGVITADQANANGLWILNGPPGAAELWVNTAKLNQDTGLAAHAALTQDVSVFANQTAGSGADNMWLGTIGFYSIGFSLSAGDIAALQNALELLYSTLGRAAADPGA
jgi:hypothetical protein